MGQDLTRVRVCSYVAAGAVIAAALTAFGLYRVNAQIEAGAPAVAIAAFVENPAETAQPPPRRARVSLARPAAAQGDRDNGLRLWRYGQRDEVIFSYAEQFDRCTQARRKHIDQADCPSSRETRAYVLDQSEDAPLVLAYRRH